MGTGKIHVWNTFPNRGVLANWDQISSAKRATRNTIISFAPPSLQLARLSVPPPKFSHPTADMSSNGEDAMYLRMFFMVESFVDIHPAHSTVQQMRPYLYAVV